MITIELQYMTPDQLEAMIRLFWNVSTGAVSEYDYNQLKLAYRNVAGQEDLDRLMSELKRQDA